MTFCLTTTTHFCILFIHSYTLHDFQVSLVSVLLFMWLNRMPSGSEIAYPNLPPSALLPFLISSLQLLQYKQEDNTRYIYRAFLVAKAKCWERALC